MKGDPKVIDYLNQSLRHELTAVNQYWLHYRLLEDWGVAKLAKKERAESLEEMQHADKLADRIIFLDGFPNMQQLNPLKIGQNVKEVLEADLEGEYSARALYTEAREVCQRRWRLRLDEAFRGSARRRGGPHQLPRDAIEAPRRDRRRQQYGQLNAESANAEE